MRKPGPTRLYEHGGKYRTLTEWATISGKSRKLLQKRLMLGWSLAAAMSTPAGQPPRKRTDPQAKCEGCLYFGRAGAEACCEYLLAMRRRRPVTAAACVGWDVEGRWRGPGPDPNEHPEAYKKSENSEGG